MQDSSILCMICNSIINGEDISKEEIAFVKANKDMVREYFLWCPELCKLAGIPEEDLELPTTCIVKVELNGHTVEELMDLIDESGFDSELIETR